MAKAKLLVVEDDEGLCRQYRWAFPEYQVIAAQTRQAGRTLFARERPAVAILDLGLPPDPAGVGEGLGLLRDLLGVDPDAKIIIATANEDTGSALQAVSIGAFDFFQKPVDNDVLRVILERAYNMSRLEQENRRIREQPSPSAVERIITADEQMLKLCSSVKRLAAADITVLIVGESGTGKEALAHALHELGPRAPRPFVAINCAAIPETLLESELFGHERGAFTGAMKQTIGKIESAHRGTLFLDEIGDLPPSLQVKLLRFLQDQVIDRVGGRQPIQLDVRIVCATNQDLAAKMQEGSFREDLFYRLNEVMLRVPPLRERTGDPMLLANFFLHKFTAQFGRRIRGYTADAIAAIAAHRWPGNVRELENRVKRAVVMSEGRLIAASDMELAPPASDGFYLDIRKARMHAEREVVQKALSQSNGTISKAAKLLGISRPTLYSLIETHGLAAALSARQAQPGDDSPRGRKGQAVLAAMARGVKLVPAALLLGTALAGSAHANDYLNDANRLIASGDLRAARIQLKNAVRSEPKDMEAHYELGSVYLELGDPVAAEHEAKTAQSGGYDPDRTTALLAKAMLAEGNYRQLLQEFPANEGDANRRAEVLVTRGYAQASLNRRDEARASFAQARQLAPKSPQPLLAEAKLMLAEHQTKAAGALFDQAAALAPHLPDALAGKALFLQSSGNLQGALGLLDKAVQEAPQLIPLRLARAEVLLDLDKRQQADSDISAVLAEQPNNGLAIYLRAIRLAKDGDFKKADAEIARVSSILNRLPHGNYLLAYVKYRLGQLNLAEDAARRYAARNPGDLTGGKLLAEIELRLGRPAEALAALDKVQRSGASDAATLALVGRADLESGQAAKAASALEAAVKAVPGAPALHYLLGISQLQLGDATGGIEQLTRSLDLAPTVPAAVLLVRTDMAQGQYDAAAKVIAKLQHAQPDSPIPGDLAGMVDIARFDLAGAHEAFAGVLAKHPDFVPARLNLARVAELQGSTDEARQLLDKVLAQQPANGEALTQLVQLLLRNGKTEEAVAAAERAHAAKPDDPAITSGLVDLYLRLGDKKKALALARIESGGNDPRAIPLIAARAGAEAASGLLQDAARSYRRLIAIEKSATGPYRRLAAVLMAAGDTAGARAAIDEAMKLAPTNAQLADDRLAIEIKAGGVPAALAWAKSYAEQHPALPFAAALQGDALAAAGQRDKALAAYEQAYRKAPSSMLVLRMFRELNAAGKPEPAAAWLRGWLKAHPDDVEVAELLGAADIGAHRYDEARRLLEETVAKQPQNAVALNNLAWLYQLTGDPRALPLAKRAYALAPKSSEIAATLGWVLTRSDHAAEAVGLLQQASSGEPGNLHLKYHLAVALNEAGRHDKAQQLLTTLVSATASFDDKPAAARLLAQLKR